MEKTKIIKKNSIRDTISDKPNCTNTVIIDYIIKANETKIIRRKNQSQGLYP